MALDNTPEIKEEISSNPVTRKCSVVWREDTDQMPLIEEAIQLLRENVLPQMIYTEVINNGSEQ